MASRAQNERKFKHWEELPNGAANMFSNSSVAQVDAPSTSKKSMRMRTRPDSCRKFTMRPVYSSPCTRSFPSIRATNSCKIAHPMKITRQTVADKITDYLQGKLSQAELVDWAERAIMDADFDEADGDLLIDIVGRLGLADVAEFGLRWQDCEEFLRRLGYRAKVIVSSE